MMESKIKENVKTGKGRYYFLGSVVLVYALSFWANATKTEHALRIVGKLVLEIIPVLFFVLILIAVLDYFLRPQKIKKYLGEESGLKGWFIAIAAGIISHGSIYAWYPLLQELRNHGMREGLAAAFLYNRAIKIPFIPLMIYYFNLKFFIVITLYMIIASVIEGLIIEKI